MTVAELASQVEVALRGSASTEPAASATAALITAVEALRLADLAHAAATATLRSEQASAGGVAGATWVVWRAAIEQRRVAVQDVLEAGSAIAAAAAGA